MNQFWDRMENFLSSISTKKEEEYTIKVKCVINRRSGDREGDLAKCDMILDATVSCCTCLFSICLSCPGSNQIKLARERVAIAYEIYAAVCCLAPCTSPT
jgi:hypothetical protein